MFIEIEMIIDRLGFVFVCWMGFGVIFKEVLRNIINMGLRMYWNKKKDGNKNFN